MKKNYLFLLFSLLTVSSIAQNKMTPELLWKLGRVGAEMMSEDGKFVYYGISYPNVDSNKSVRNIWKIPVAGGTPIAISTGAGSKNSVRQAPNGKLLYNFRGAWWLMNADGSDSKALLGLPEEADNVQFSPDGTKLIFSNEVKISKVAGVDFYPELKKSNVLIYSSLNNRHWDTWEDGNYSHVFYANYSNGVVDKAIDIMEGQAFDCPQKPNGGADDLLWSPDSKSIVYVTKQSTGTAYATSTNTDIFQYFIATAKTENLSSGLMGYDVAPAFSSDGNSLAWLSMSRDGFEADKNNLMVMNLANHAKMNITAQWDNTCEGFRWDNAAHSIIYFTAYTQGTEQLYSVRFPADAAPTAPVIRQITSGDFDINGIVGQTGQQLLVARTDMNHASELFSVTINDGKCLAITHANDAVYSTLDMPKVEKTWVTTSDGKKMLVWVVLPVGFDASKQYPTLLYCQGGPQSALSQFYSFRWNFQLMASQGYIVVAPNRRGMPGHGVQWNEAISKDWGGQPIQDYLTAIDSISARSYVDKNRRAAVGASYGGYSVFMLAGVHQNRFKAFIAHDGVFDTRSWYGTTEEIWFSKWDMGGPYWDSKNEKSFTKFNPITMVDKWNAPILIYQGAKDFRTPIEQGLQAFQAAQLRGIKSKLVLLPTENHWVLSAQNAIIWQHEFYNWLSDNLK
jgi:dipeptidyl aminopeptidase/acylaminoacyl peptidase